ncbi:hypothetical protein D7Z26_00990 [Cohnella endophytica]|uniref:Aminoglycoside phosphotransferase domain-containing protein n=1 Tax=Cohnella endophytica TaxID=2419778 RepID=A0A494Y662_9BACL|nr:phosphotransferase [Cohnella endophytica]RKP58112.1 hypothetical protein D7Z26_00990 [Cohnella endophytica]
MKLSVMTSIFGTVDEGWRSPFAEQLASPWGFDPGTLFFWRASANAIFILKRGVRDYYLRINEGGERRVEEWVAETAILHRFHETPVQVAQPVVSRFGRYVETAETELGVYHAMLFEALPGSQSELSEMTSEDIRLWGAELGKFHRQVERMPVSVFDGRPGVLELLENAGRELPEDDASSRKEWKDLTDEAQRLLESKPRDFERVVHYDFQPDNLRFDNGRIGVIDFDDCARLPAEADIAYALADLSSMTMEFDHPIVEAFMSGYRSERKPDAVWLDHLDWFLRLNRFLSYARLIRSLEIGSAFDDDVRMDGLRSKLLKITMELRESFDGR